MSKKKEPLTKKQKAILSFVVRFQSKYGYPPTRAEIQLQFMFNSQNAVVDHLKAIEAKGWLILEKNKARGIKILK